MMKTTHESVCDELQAAQTVAKRNRAEGLSKLNQLFRTGTLPELSLDGRYAGELVTFDITPGLTELAYTITNAWMPWKGKTFDASRQQGDNLFTRDSKWVARLFNPFYKGFVTDSPETYRAFTFRTYTAPGLADPDRIVFKIDYDLEGNPPLTIRRVLDELVQLTDDLYLGKAHVHWWWDRWQMVAYFTLVLTEAIL